MSETPAFTQFAPGFEFLQNLMKGANSAIPGMGQWVAPTLNPEEIEKRISELRTVQFWLEQNTRMIAATIQALEVQRMTLATLKTMNVQLGDLRESLSIHPHPHPAADAAPASAAPASAHTSAPAPAAGAAPLVDPVKWWGALTEQFTHLAANAMKEVAPHAPGAAAAKPAATAAKPRKPASKAASKTAAPRAQASAPSSTKSRSAPAKRRST